ELHRDFAGVPVDDLVDGVVEDLPDEVVIALFADTTDVHPRPGANVLDAFEILQRRGVVALRLRGASLLFGHALFLGASLGQVGHAGRRVFDLLDRTAFDDGAPLAATIRGFTLRGAQFLRAARTPVQHDRIARFPRTEHLVARFDLDEDDALSGARQEVHLLRGAAQQAPLLRHGAHFVLDVHLEHRD